MSVVLVEAISLIYRCALLTFAWEGAYWWAATDVNSRACVQRMVLSSNQTGWKNELCLPLRIVGFPYLIPVHPLFAVYNISIVCLPWHSTPQFSNTIPNRLAHLDIPSHI